MPRGDFWKSWQERLIEGGILDTESGCIEWSRSKNNRGYGLIYFDGKLRLAHRAAWLDRHGKWPAEGLVVDHICNNKGCVNPDHLREIENWRNIRRAYPTDDPAVMRRREAQRRADEKRRTYTSPTYSASYDKGGE